jgi:hypothetical protein
MARHLFVEPTPLREVAPAVSAGVSAAVHAALAKQAHDRPTARELREALASVALGTDREALGEAAAELRSRTAGLARSERAIDGREAGAVRGGGGAGAGRVIVWVSGSERGAAIRGCLATAGLSCSLAGDDAAPDLGLDRGPVVVVVSARDGLGRVGRVRALGRSIPVVVVDVAGPDETTEVIRAGASDMLLRAAPDTDLVAKLARLARRRGTA